ncbi:hypothetical protein AZE42_10840, partial [Rhizopogon vesiculosus]
MMHLHVLWPEGPRAKARSYPHLHMMKTQMMPARIHKTLMPTIPLCLVGSQRKKSARQLPWASERLKRQPRLPMMKPTRTENPWNMYQAWYKMKHPKSS